MAEWTKARDSKSRIPKGIGGSNPSLSVLFDGRRWYFNRKIRSCKSGVSRFYHYKKILRKRDPRTIIKIVDFVLCGTNPSLSVSAFGGIDINDNRLQ